MSKSSFWGHILTLKFDRNFSIPRVPRTTLIKFRSKIMIKMIIKFDHFWVKKTSFWGQISTTILIEIFSIPRLPRTTLIKISIKMTIKNDHQIWPFLGAKIDIFAVKFRPYFETIFPAKLSTFWRKIPSKIGSKYTLNVRVFRCIIC